MYVSDNPYYLDQNLVILGMVNNAEKQVDMILYQLESVACLFNSTTFILFESNSEDKTLFHLQKWSLRKPLNCSQIAFKPSNKRKYHDLYSLDDLIHVFTTNMVNTDDELYYDESEKEVNDMIADFLQENYSDILQVNVREICKYLTNKLKMYGLTEIQIEEILYEKLMPIKYVKYRKQIDNHKGSIHKYLMHGDEMVESELKIETEIIRQLRIYGGLNELHTGYNAYEDMQQHIKKI